MITPKEYLEVKHLQQIIIDDANRAIIKARREAEQCPFPEHVRRAKAEDIKAGAVIWYKRYHGGHSWLAVEKENEVACLEDAYVEEEFPAAKQKPALEFTVTEAEVIYALEEFVILGKEKNAGGYFDSGWAGGCLKWHLEQLKAKQE